MPKKEPIRPGCWKVSDTPEGRLQDWLVQWEKGNWDFLYTEPGVMLAKHFEKVTGGKKGLKILVPLCATSYDIIWLCDQGHTVVGIDLGESGAQRIFKQLKQKPVIQDVPSIDGKLYKNSSGTLKYYVGDFFKFTAELEGQFDYIWDTKALCAIDERDRKKYLEAVRRLMAPKCSMMLEFPKNILSGAPYHFAKEEIESFYGDICDVEYLGESEFDLTKAFHGDIDDDGNPIREEEEASEEAEKSGEGKKPMTVLVMECYSLKSKNC